MTATAPGNRGAQAQPIVSLPGARLVTASRVLLVSAVLLVGLSMPLPCMYDDVPVWQLLGWLLSAMLRDWHAVPSMLPLFLGLLYIPIAPVVFWRVGGRGAKMAARAAGVCLLYVWYPPVYAWTHPGASAVHYGYYAMAAGHSLSLIGVALSAIAARSLRPDTTGFAVVMRPPSGGNMEADGQ